MTAREYFTDSMSGCYRYRHRLRDVVFSLSGHAEIEWPAVHRRKFWWEIPVSRRTRRRPFQCCRMPRIAFQRPFARKNTEQEVKQENQLRCTQHESGDRYEHIHRLLLLQEHVLSWIIDPSHLPADSDDMHRKEHAIGADEGEPEMNLSESGVHETAKHLRKPEIEAPKGREQRSDRHYQVKMRYHEIGILQLDIRSRRPQKNSA